ncbi:MAG TPA: hypothetical protein H9915_02075 [Candidatus Gemmiger faecigallinarum]|nr:hypothetical protein [Candidatus Gemmiger faecigallinarum]
MPNGSLQIYTTTAGQSAPLAGVVVSIFDEGGTRLARVVTDAEGAAPEVALEAPSRTLSLDESNTTQRPYAVYQLTAVLAGWQQRSVAGIQVFDGQQTVARLEFLPADAALARVQQELVVIPEHALFAGDGGSGQPPAALADPRVLTEVVLPRRITVHLGAPSSSARNVTVPFQDYIANVASSEVYPTWEGYRNSQKARRSISISPSIRQLFPYPTKNRIMDPYRAIVLPPGPLSQKCRTRRYCLVLSPPISF